MKKFIFLMGVVTALMISCTGSKVNLSASSAYETYKNKPFAQGYANNPSLMSEDSAKSMIANFRFHKFKGLRGGRLKNAWVTFDPKLLNQLSSDPNVEQICFRFASQLKWKHDTSWLPAILLQAIMKDTAQINRGNVPPSSSLYFSSISLCPPPKTGCTVPYGQ